MLTDQDYIDLLRLVQDYLDWDPNDDQVGQIEGRLALECSARGLKLPAEQQQEKYPDEPNLPH